MIVHGCGQDNYLSLLNVDESRWRAILDWIESCRQKQGMQVIPVSLHSLTQWSFADDTGDLLNNSGGFFSVSGLSANRRQDEFQWNQPIIVQPEIGILGILTKKINGCRHFLMQAKNEPGNIGGVQISPTIQATWSNYTGVHKGKNPDYLKYFLDYDERHLLSRQLLSEQGARFFKKKNLNIIIESETELEEKANFFWMTLGDLKRLSSQDNLLNMDTRTVLSTLDFSGVDELQVGQNNISAAFFKSSYNVINHPEPDCFLWWASQDFKQIEVERINLNQLTDWQIDSRGHLNNIKKAVFSVIGVTVSAIGREVDSWDQPLFSSNGSPGLIGCIVTIKEGTLLFLLKAKAEVGNREILELSPTLSISNYQSGERLSSEKFSAYFTSKRPGKVIFDGMQSEEGGRFFQMENRNMMVCVEEDEFSECILPDNYRWFTLSEIRYMQDKGLVNIDLRTLLACFPLNVSL